jgi:ParB-like chromosome segregation protein Spo0J
MLGPTSSSGHRRREHPGTLQWLQDSIAEHGLINPLVIRNRREPVFGARRRKPASGWAGAQSLPAR